MKVYRIQSGKLWYQGKHCIGPDEDNSPLFTNLKRAEKQIRDNYKTLKENIERWKQEGVQLDISWFNELKFWKNAKTVSYTIVKD